MSWLYGSENYTFLRRTDSAPNFPYNSTVLPIRWNFIENKDLQLLCIILGAMWFLILQSITTKIILKLSFYARQMDQLDINLTGLG